MKINKVTNNLSIMSSHLSSLLGLKLHKKKHRERVVKVEPALFMTRPYISKKFKKKIKNQNFTSKC